MFKMNKNTEYTFHKTAGGKDQMRLARAVTNRITVTT